MKEKFFVNNSSIQLLVEKTFEEIAEIQARSIAHQFDFSVWIAGLGSKIFERRAPEYKQFRCVLASEFYQVLSFYSQSTNRESSGGDYWIPTLQKPKIVKSVCDFAKSLNWAVLQRHLKIAIWLLACGYDDNFRNTNDVTCPVWRRSECTEYLQSEEKVGNMFQVQVLPWPREHIVACEYFSIEEEKTDCNGEKYTKHRFVSNLIPANQQIHDEFLASDLKYNFVTAETIFTDLNMFEKLLITNHLSIVDKRDYYRQLVSNPSLCSAVVGSDENVYIDLKLKQGHKFSSCFAQLASDFIDLAFEKRFGPNFQASLQDDSLIFHINDSLILDDVIDLNRKFGFELNHKKTIFRKKRLVWSGYLWDLRTLSLAIPEEKLQKVQTLTIKILNEPCTRRDYAKLLGKLYSYRLLAAGARANFSILTHRTRSHMFKNTGNFYQELKNLNHFSKKYLDKYKRFFDKTLEPDASLEQELTRAVDIISRPREFKDVRTYVFGNNALPTSCVTRESALLFTDSSLKAGGAFLEIGQSCFSLSFSFSDEDADLRNASINIKELYSAILAILWTLEISQVHPITSVIVFIDNECAKSLAFTKKANLKSTKLLKMAEVLNNILMACEIPFFFTRIPTEKNQAADFLSRKFEESFCRPVGRNWWFEALTKTFISDFSPSKVPWSSGPLLQTSDTSSAALKS